MKRIHVSGLAGSIGLLLGVAILTMAAAAPASAAPALPGRTLVQGAGIGAKPDPDVRRLQRVLKSQGRSLGPAGVDGRFGPDTAAAVRSLQGKFGLPADGIVGPKTRKLVRVLCRTGECPGVKGAKANRSRPSGARTEGRAAVSNDDGSGSDAFENAIPTLVALVALLFGILAYNRWRTSRRTRAYAAPASRFPAVEVRSTQPARRKAIGYLGTADFTLTSPAAETREKAIVRACGRRDWVLLDVLSEVPGGGHEALAYALDAIDAGQANCLVVASLESVGGSAAALARVLERLQSAGACFVAIDAEVDTTTPEGTMAAALRVAVTKNERERAVSHAGNGRSHIYGEGGVV
jgi:peptidoglycan hydrolase-like protein with peptidoglycan-binding domain